MSLLRLRRGGKTSSPLSPREWSNKNVLSFLEQHDLHAYTRAARKAKLRGCHLLDVAATTFKENNSQYERSTSAAKKASRRSVATPEALVSPRSIRRASHSNEGLMKLCGQLGVISEVDRHRLWLALIMLAGQDDEASASGTRDARVGLMATRVVALRKGRTTDDLDMEIAYADSDSSEGLHRSGSTISDDCSTTGSSEVSCDSRKRSASFGAVETSSSGSSFFTPTDSPAMSPLTSPGRKSSSTPQSPSRFSLALSGFFKNNKSIRRSSAGTGNPAITSPKNEDPVPRKMSEGASLLSRHLSGSSSGNSSQEDLQLRRWRERHNKSGNLYMAYCESHGQLVMKCCLEVLDQDVLQDINGLGKLQKKESQMDREKTTYADISLIRLDVNKPLLFQDLMCEIHRLHGPLLFSVQQQHREAGGDSSKFMRVKFEDREGDLVNITNDHSLQYAIKDWRQRAKRTPGRSVRLVVEVAPPPAPLLC